MSHYRRAWSVCRACGTPFAVRARNRGFFCSQPCSLASRDRLLPLDEWYAAKRVLRGDADRTRLAGYGMRDDWHIDPARCVAHPVRQQVYLPPPGQLALAAFGVVHVRR